MQRGYLGPPPIRHMLVQNWAAPAKTIALGAILITLFYVVQPVYYVTYISILVPICMLTSVTQICLGLIKAMSEGS